MSRYEFVQENVVEGYILDRNSDYIVALVSTKRPDLEFSALKELVEKANKNEEMAR